MSKERSILNRSLRAVSLSIAVVAIISIAALAYSGYSEFGTVVGVANGSATGVSERTVVSGSTAVVYINATITNNGLLPIGLGFVCGNNQEGVDCFPGSVVVQPGDQGVLGFHLVVDNYTRFQSGGENLEVNGNFTFALIPFATMQVSTNLGSAVNFGGA